MNFRLLSALILLLLPASHALAEGPSFDCALAKSVIETEICKDPVLAKADALMAKLYFQAKTSAFRSGPSNQLSVQRVWAKDRQDCLEATKKGYDSVGQCLQRRYDQRNHDLASATVMSDPPIGLDALARLDPESAPLYQAIRAYIRSPNDHGALVGLLKPYFTPSSSDNDRLEILQSENIARAEDMIASDKAFAMGMKILSAFLQDRPVTLPCEAVIDRPGLLDMVQPYFGSTRDNFIPRTNCAAALPPLPKFDLLVTQINKGWPPCEGTIRYSAYRTFEAEVEAARLADGSTTARAKPARRLKGVTPDAIAAATTELATYYQTYRFLPPAKAQATALGSVRGVLATGQVCI